MQVGEKRYHVSLSYSEYKNLKAKEKRQLQRDKGFDEKEFKTEEAADKFAEQERQRTGLKIVVQECWPIYGLF